MPETLVTVSNAMAAAVEKAGNSTVRIEARRRLPATGFVWSDGVIVTANHVVERDDNITIGLPGGETAEATLVGRDPSTDLAVLKTSAKGLAALERVPFDALKVGHLVLALGRPGKQIQATHGIISTLGTDSASRAGHLDYYVQTDVDMNPGFSGGPLIDAAGALIGMNTSAMRDTSLSIPTPTLTRVVDALLQHGKVKQGYLGIGAQPVRLPASFRDQLGQETGLLIASVEPESPADKGGVLLGDTLVAFGGQKVRGMDDLAGALSANGVGATVTATLIRAGSSHELTITIGERA